MSMPFSDLQSCQCDTHITGAYHLYCNTCIGYDKEKLRIDYCGFGPFCSTRANLLLSISLLKVLICIIYQLKDKYLGYLMI